MTSDGGSTTTISESSSSSSSSATMLSCAIVVSTSNVGLAGSEGLARLLSSGTTSSAMLASLGHTTQKESASMVMNVSLKIFVACGSNLRTSLDGIDSCPMVSAASSCVSPATSLSTVSSSCCCSVVVPSAAAVPVVVVVLRDDAAGAKTFPPATTATTPSVNSEKYSPAERLRAGGRGSAIFCSSFRGRFKIISSSISTSFSCLASSCSSSSLDVDGACFLVVVVVVDTAATPAAA
mmetsp:Transcript_5874/g.14439  ORF Transcript_5874/g.14439 Transcript_5874/m.14439 type:complete len:237 (+) Transcript_5874:1611-2321(+)